MSTVLEQPVRKESVETNNLYRLSIERYHKFINAGILNEADKIELLDGLLIAKMTKTPRHELVLGRIQKVVSKLIPSNFDVRSQGPVTLSKSEPEPDLSIVRGSIEDFPNRHPGSSDCALIIEVSESSLKLDQGLKKSIYATDNLPEYWILNLINNLIEVYSEPANGEYAKQTTYTIDQVIPFAIDGQMCGEVKVRDVLK